MTYLRFKTLIGIYGLILLSTIIQSCCEENFRITSNGSMQAWELYESENGIGRKNISTVTGDFILGAYFQEEITMLNNMSLISSCYATSCKETWLNSVDETSLDISIEKSFLLNGELIPANTNLLKVEDSGVELHSVFGGWIEFRFTEFFFSNVELENGSCKFNFKGSTNDYIMLEAEISLTIEL